MKKQIHINFCDFYSSFDKENNRFMNTLKKQYDVFLSDTPDFLFYSCFGNEYLKFENCVKIFFSGENCLPNFNECDYACGFGEISFYGRFFETSFSEEKLNSEIQNTKDLSDNLANRLFCNFIYSNDSYGSGSQIRQEFCKKLMQYKHVDCPGRVLNNMTDAIEPRKGNWSAGKLEFIKKYKFTIAFENTYALGYTTEKLFQPFQARSIPIYWGNPDIVKKVNPKAFINCNDFDNDLEAVIKRVIELDTDKSKYMDMLRQPPLNATYEFNHAEKFAEWLYHIIEKGNHSLTSDTWYNARKKHKMPL